MSKKIPQSTKDEVAKRANYCCEYSLALSKYSPDPFCIEHIVPFSKGGSNKKENLAFSCSGCNNHKYTHTQSLDPLTGRISPLYHPRKNKWKDHFRWNIDSNIILGITAIGRASVERLKLNREGLRNQRAVLAKIGKHPPIF